MTILLGLAIVFVVCQFLPIVGDVHTLIGTLGGYSIDGIRPFNMHIENCITVGHFMLILNSSVNFVFYMVNTDEYRQEFFRVSLTYVLRLMCTNCIITKLKSHPSKSRRADYQSSYCLTKDKIKISGAGEQNSSRLLYIL